MSTTKGQRIGIWIIAIVMTVGTIGSFFVIVIANSNNQKDQQTAQQQYQKQLEEYKKMMEEEKKKNRPLAGYEVEKFNADSVKELKVTVLKQGDGDVLTEDSTISANYFGWTYDGEIFDSTTKVDQEATPIEFSLKGVIKGWTQGLTGVKVGSVVKLLIPADLAYGSTDDGSGRPYGPLAFIVEVVKEVK